METILNNVATFLFLLHPFFMYKVHKVATPRRCKADNATQELDKNVAMCNTGNFVATGNVVNWLKRGQYVNFSAFITISLLILPPLWLLLNWQLANMLLVIFILGAYYLFKGVLDDVNEIRKSK
jgi:hypothetical protein